MRDLKPGDRVKITGPWIPDSEGIKGSRGGEYIGRKADVLGDHSPGYLKIHLDVSGIDYFIWCRENLRARPRRK